MRNTLIGLVAVCLIACGGPKVPSGPPVVVYASEADPADLPALFEAFTAATGIPVSPVWGSPKDNADALIDKVGIPADVLITPSVIDIWRVAEEGALRPIQSEALSSVNSELREPENLWVALQRRDILIVGSSNASVSSPDNYQALAASGFRGKLCLSSIDNSINQTVIAMLVEDVGLKPAERIVRGWISNLAQSPFKSEQALVEALETDACEFGIVSSAAGEGEFRHIEHTPSYYDISAMGVGRHAQSAERAQRLVDWLIVNHPLRGSVNSNGRNIGISGWRNVDVLLLADRVGYR